MGIIKLKSLNKDKVEDIETRDKMQCEEGIDASQTWDDVQEQWDNPAVLYEDETRADENSRHYFLNNGTAKSIFNAKPVNFFDAGEEKWKHIDNTFEEKEDAFESKNGKFKTCISKVHKGKKVAISKSDMKLSWEYLGKQVVAVVNENVEKATETVLKINNGKVGKEKHINSSAVYENIEKDTDIEYCLLGNNLKENIIVKEKSAEYRYLFALKTEGLKLRLAEDNGRLEFYSEKEKEGGTIEQRVEFIIPSPYMYDANGVASDDVYYELEASEEGKFTFAVIADEEWVNADDRVFPVTIDPQIVVNEEHFVATQMYYRTVTYTDPDSSTDVTYGDWTTTDYAYIRVQCTASLDYMAELTIKKSLLSLMDLPITSVKLILTPYGSVSGSMYFNGSLINYSSSSGNLELDITSLFKSSTGDFTVALEPYSFTRMVFDSESNPPVIEIEYLTNENIRPTKKTFSLAGIATGTVNLANGNMTTSICDVKPEDSVMGMGIYHIHKRTPENYLLGSNFRLNLHETLIACTDGDYVYTDQNGDKHGFIDYYYYINASGQKTYITDKNEIVVDAEGKMTYTESEQTHSVICEYKSTAGLKAMTTLEGIKNVEFLEQRSDEIKANQDKLESYRNALKDYVLVNKSSGAIENGWRLKDYLAQTADFSKFLEKANASSYLLLNESEAINYHSLIIQRNNYTSYYYDANIVPDVYSIKKSLATTKYSLYECTKTLLTAIDNDDVVLSDDEQEAIENCLNSESLIIPAESYDDFNDLPILEGTDVNATFDSKARERNLLVKQLQDQTQSITAQLGLINNQIDLYLNKKKIYIEQITKYYREYLALLAEQKMLERQTPVNFLTDGHYIKGFNAEGQFVALYDRYENYAVIEYENYFEETVEKSRISRVYNNREQQALFTYNEKNQLTEITDVRGRKTCFTYDISNTLIGITYDTSEKLILTCSGNNIVSLIEEKNGLVTSITYTNNRPTRITNGSTIRNISVNGAGGTSIAFPPRISISYSGSPITYTTITEGLVMERYYFDSNRNCREYRKAEFDKSTNQYLVSAAERYIHNPYWAGSNQKGDPKKVVTKAAVSSLYQTTLASYSFVAGDTETTVIDQFNNPVSKTTSAILVSEWLDLNDEWQQNKQTTTVNYTYDDNQKLIQEKITVLDSNPTKTLVSYKKYTYNAYGDVIRTESYVEGEEYTTGKTIEETVYDKQGNVIKSLTYNSLDASSKFYTETEYDEEGKVSAEVDELGENRTKFSYVNGTSIVREENFPNGSKFAYGYDYDDSLTAISQSTEDGEENSTQRVYRCGELVELKSGNNNVRYTYNGRRKLVSVDLNDTTDYVQYAYQEILNSNDGVVLETATATYKSGDVFISEKDGNGNLLKLTANNVVQLENVYDKKGQLEILKDKITHKNYKLVRDNLDKVKVIHLVDDNGTALSGGYLETIEYNADGNVKTRSILGDVSQVYNYAYKANSLHTLASIKFREVAINPKTDAQGRNKGKSFAINNEKAAEEIITYRKVGDHATNMPSSIWFGDVTSGSFQIKDNLKYAYDKMGNIEKVYENGELAIRYQYDALNRLVREDNKALDKTYIMVYDNNGNIVKRRAFAFTLKDSTLIEEIESTDKEYLYNGEQMVSYNGELCGYDVIGNPTTYRGKAATWTNGRRLASYDGHTFTYDGRGRRIKKDNVSFVYDFDGRLIKQGADIEFFYDHTGVAGFYYSGLRFLYRKDAQGNVIALLFNGRIMARYLYDAWGNVTVVDNNGEVISDATHVGHLNPFRYRGYYYDTETKLYFLNTRYYDPETGRFMTIDGIEYLDPETINGLNLYAYCNNNPVMNIDPNGTWSWKKFWRGVAGALAVVALAVVVGVSVVVTGGASLAAIGAGFVIGTTSSVVAQGITNVINGNNFFHNINIGTVLIAGLAGAAFASGLGGLAGAFGIGVASSVATSAVEGKSIGEILFNGLVGGLCASLAFGVGQLIGRIVYQADDFVFASFLEMVKVDGANAIRGSLTAFASSWFKFLPSITPGTTRAVLNFFGKKIGEIFND